MLIFLVRRFFGLIFVLFAVTFLTFMIGHAAPGDPIKIMMGLREDPAAYQRLRHFYGLDRPLLIQYVEYVWNIVRYFNFGYSYQYNQRPVAAILGTALPVTFTIGLLALALATVVGVPIGVYAAARHNRVGDRVSSSLLFAHARCSLLGSEADSFIGCYSSSCNITSRPSVSSGTLRSAPRLPA